MNFTEILDRVIQLDREQDRDNLREYLSNLKVGEIYWVLTIMYLGRDRGGIAGIYQQYDYYSCQPFAKVWHAIDQILEKPLAEYIENGQRILSDGGVDINTLLTTHDKSPLAILNDGDDVELQIGPWYCDCCGKETDNLGMLVWLTRTEDGRHFGRDIRILHTADECYPNQRQEMERDKSVIASDHIRYFLGHDGLVRLLQLYQDGPFSPDALNPIIMRLQIPGYEQARPYFQQALQLGIVHQNAPDGYFREDQLKTIIANIPKIEEHFSK